jgi:asparagine synthetase B (glutamine-hydrolysing)
MWLMARVIKSMGIKMVLSGEGADELLEDICISQSAKRKRIPRRKRT